MILCPPSVQTSASTSDRSTESSLVHDAKFVLMVQPMNLQGAIWQAILRSQQISVIWEAADVNLQSSLVHLKEAGLAPPDLILIDTRVQTFNAYTFCRWCRDHCPETKVVLVSGAQKEVTPSERAWALYQGASELLPRFRRDSLVSGAVTRVRRILDLLDCSTLNQSALVTSLLAIQKVTNSRDPDYRDSGYKDRGYAHSMHTDSDGL